jgi:tRNA modification GTPase
MLGMDVGRRDTICALATPQGKSAIALVRVSGPKAHDVQSVVFKAKRKPADDEPRFFMAQLGDVFGNEQHLDEAVCTAFPAGKSYTGEPSFELALHGNPLIAASTIKALVAAGCRLAEPGEFTLRAFLSGKLDLAQAEAVCDVISARSEAAAQTALKMLKGGLEQTLAPVYSTIINTLAEIEARLDFPDEGLSEAHTAALVADLKRANSTLDTLLKSATLGRRLMEGARVVLYGAPNAGKSTLMNALLGEERAIVHESPGTTRDVLEANWVVEGIPVMLIDVAGIRSGEEVGPVEAMGIERAERELARADLVLFLEEMPSQHCHASESWDLDQGRRDERNHSFSKSNAPATQTVALDACLRRHDNGEANHSFPKSTEAPYIRVFTKADLGNQPRLSHEPSNPCVISAKTGDGLAQLKQRIAAHLGAYDAHADEVVLTKERQREEVAAAADALQGASALLRARSADELVCHELRESGAALDRLLGRALNETVLDLIFSRFCIGK